MSNTKVYLALMESESYDWYGIGETIESAVNAILNRWNDSETREQIELDELLDHYSINVHCIEMNTAINTEDF